MIIKTKRRATVAYRNFQSFSNFCFEAEKILSSKDESSDNKIHELKKFASFFVIDSILPSIQIAKKVFREAELVNSPAFKKNIGDVTSLFGYLDSFEESTLQILDLLKKSFFEEICYFESVANIAKDLQAEKSEIIGSNIEPRLIDLCEATMTYIPDFRSQTSLITSILGQLILES